MEKKKVFSRIPPHLRNREEPLFEIHNDESATRQSDKHPSDNGNLNEPSTRQKEYKTIDIDKFLEELCPPRKATSQQPDSVCSEGDQHAQRSEGPSPSSLVDTDHCFNPVKCETLFTYPLTRSEHPPMEVGSSGPIFTSAQSNTVSDKAPRGKPRKKNKSRKARKIGPATNPKDVGDSSPTSSFGQSSPLPVNAAQRQSRNKLTPHKPTNSGPSTLFAKKDGKPVIRSAYGLSREEELLKELARGNSELLRGLKALKERSEAVANELAAVREDTVMMDAPDPEIEGKKDKNGWRNKRKQNVILGKNKKVDRQQVLSAVSL
ncbi:hypothetical protein BJ508DRAFT_329940 [Ascobolus immersus RN42]|uniref:Uncharacterized protein n=1 Tax=Ascobolus immersus RN42 TaxID=1160509 RepID=A0A3N4HUZ7_ASCIM|nr:hypothetical protein BJ508DRAFT_329940 [Ascobolus immersus RN42]